MHASSVEGSALKCIHFYCYYHCSQVLLPCSMMVALTGPKDKPAMDINVVVDPISLTISPAIVRLIIHATKTLIPEKVVHAKLLML